MPMSDDLTCPFVVCSTCRNRKEGSTDMFFQGQNYVKVILGKKISNGKLDQMSIYKRLLIFSTIKKIVFPLLKSPFIFTLIYTFLKSLTTLSAVMFLVTPKYSLASVYIINMVESGLWGSAAALALFLILICATLLILLNVILGDKMKLFQL